MPNLEGIDGGFAPSPVAGGESNLDLQISYPIIYPQNSIIFQTDDLAYTEGLQNSSGFLNTFLDAIDGSYCTYSAFGETVNRQICRFSLI
jgi:tripeptidyl-peptidase-1